MRAEALAVQLAGEESCAPRTEAHEARTQNGVASLQALCAIARFHQIAADPAALAHQLGLQPSDAVTTADLLRAAKHLGLKAKLTSTTASRLPLTPLPALAFMQHGEGAARVMILAQCDGQRVLLQDPSAAVARPVIESIEAFTAQWTGELILIASRASLAGELAKFDFSWFVPAIVKYRKLLGEVLLISLMLQLFALVSPLFFQVVMDKVLVHRGLTTLDVLVIGLVVVVVFESALNGLRSYVMARGYGIDSIVENDSTAGNTDVAVFAADIAADQLWFRQSGSDLKVDVIGTADEFVIKNWFSGGQYHVEQFKSGDGRTLLDSQVQNLVNAMASFQPPAAGQTTLTPTYQNALGGVIAANWH
jgi:hypothetical protein